MKAYLRARIDAIIAATTMKHTQLGEWAVSANNDIVAILALDPRPAIYAISGILDANILVGV
ncbi:hypothetical protein BCR16_04155 [Ralstonia solanacearum FJAT-1458]|nr:hypothetical protein BCR16_04155 [Ralstonia solanacearum FJAT-1458]